MGECERETWDAAAVVCDEMLDADAFWDLEDMALRKKRKRDATRMKP
jgi:hypothetical protein